jgi:hypothetical protein
MHGHMNVKTNPKFVCLCLTPGSSAVCGVSVDPAVFKMGDVGGGMIPNADDFVPDYTASHPRKRQF